MSIVKPTRRIHYIEIDNESSFHGTIYVVKDSTVFYKVGPTEPHSCVKWDLEQIKGLNNGDEIQVRLARDNGASATSNLDDIITVDTTLTNVAQYLVHGTLEVPKITFQGMPIYGGQQYSTEWALTLTEQAA